MRFRLTNRADVDICGSWRGGPYRGSGPPASRTACRPGGSPSAGRRGVPPRSGGGGPLCRSGGSAAGPCGSGSRLSRPAAAGNGGRGDRRLSPRRAPRGRPRGPNDRGVHAPQAPADPPPLVELRPQEFEDFQQRVVLRPPGEPAADRCPRAVPVGDLRHCAAVCGARRMPFRTVRRSRHCPPRRSLSGGVASASPHCPSVSSYRRTARLRRLRESRIRRGGDSRDRA